MRSILLPHYVGLLLLVRDVSSYEVEGSCRFVVEVPIYLFSADLVFSERIGVTLLDLVQVIVFFLFSLNIDCKTAELILFLFRVVEEGFKDAIHFPFVLILVFDYGAIDVGNLFLFNFFNLAYGDIALADLGYLDMLVRHPPLNLLFDERHFLYL